MITPEYTHTAEEEEEGEEEEAVPTSRLPGCPHSLCVYLSILIGCLLVPLGTRGGLVRRRTYLARLLARTSE